MVVGASRVGKTSLLKRLIGERFDPGEASTVGVEQDMIYTRDVSKWRKKDDFAIYSSPTEELVRVTRSMASAASLRSHETGTFHQSHDQRHPPEIKAKVLQKARETDESTEKLEHEEQMTYHLWDFGGQHVYHITHPIFLTWRAIYILVINLDKEHSTNTNDVLFWLKSIFAHAVKPDIQRREQRNGSDESDEPKIILVGTHADAVRDTVEERIKAIKKEVQGTPYRHQITHFFDVDNANEHDPKIEKIREAVDEQMDRSSFMNEEVPTRWVLLEDRIHKLAQKSFYLTRSELGDELQVLGIMDNEAEAALIMFHHFGKIVYYKDSGIVVLDPQWLNGIITKVIAVVDEERRSAVSDEWAKLEKQGVLTEKLINHVWKEHREVKDELLKIMERFDLICEINQECQSKSTERSGEQENVEVAVDPSLGERSFFVPCLAEEVLQEREKKKDHVRFRFLIDFHGFLPVGFVHRLFVHIARWTMGKGSHIPRFRSKEMTFFVDKHHQLVTEAIDEKEIQVTMMNVDPRTRSDIEPSVMTEFSRVLENALQELKERWARQIKYTVGMRCENCLKHNYEHLVTIPLEEFLSNDIAVCKECDERIDTGAIQKVFGVTGGKDDAFAANTGCDKLCDAYFADLAKDIGSEWHELGIRLGFIKAELDRITEEKPEIYYRTLTILQRWLQRSTKNEKEKVCELSDALKKCKRDDLSLRVKSDFFRLV